MPVEQLLDARGVWYAALHILEASRVGLGVGHVAELRAAVGNRQDPIGQRANRDLLAAADIEDPAYRAWVTGQADERADDIADMAEAAALGAVAEDGQRVAAQRL